MKEPIQNQEEEMNLVETQIKPDRVKIVASVAIALASVFIATIGGLAALTYSSASDAQRRATIASFNYEKFSMASYSEMFFWLRADLDYEILSALAQDTEIIGQRAEDRGDSTMGQMLRSQAEIYLWASDTPKFYSEKVAEYKTGGGAFDEEAFLADKFEGMVLEIDVDSERELELADKFFNRTQTMLYGIAVLALTIFFFTLAEITEHWLRYVWLGAGALTMIISFGIVNVPEIIANL